MSASDARSDDAVEPVVRVEQRDDVLTITLNRPDQGNSLNTELVEALGFALQQAGDPSVRAVVLTGAGRNFCTGVDIRSPRQSTGRAGGLRAIFNPYVLAIAGLQKPVIAAVNGAAAGAGLALACAADIRIASTAARFVPAFAKIGVIPDAGGSYFVPRLIGHGRAFEWLTSSTELPVERALEWGLVNAVVAPEELAEAAHQRAASLAAMPGLGVGLTKVLLNEAWSATLAQQLDREADLQTVAINAPGRAAARAAMVDRLGGTRDARPDSEPSTNSPTQADPTTPSEGRT
jgi:2-(1,2-epoxy-1,2-dihydrophenyl)acetyl-CoA isomerase